MMPAAAKFALGFEDEISASAESAEQALQTLQNQIDKDAKSLTQMQKAMRQIKAAGGADEGTSAYKKLQAEIAATTAGIGKARSSFIDLGGKFDKVGKKAKKTKLAPTVEAPKGMSEMLSAANSLPGPLSKVSKGVGGVQSVVTGLTGSMGLALGAIVAVVATLVALAAVLAVVAAATVKATAALIKYAAAQADAMRSERLRLQGLGTLRRWMRMTGKDSAQMSESINRVSERVPLARSQVQEYGQELHRLGISGRAAEDALEALSTAQAVQGDLGRRRLMMLVRQAGHSEGAMRDLAARTRRELGGIAFAQMSSLSMITTKLGESFKALFTGVNIGPLLSGLFRLSRLLSQSTESGRALRTIISTVLSAFIGEIADATPRLEYFLKEMVILSLKVAIAFFKVKNAIEEAFGSKILGRMLATSRGSVVVKIVVIALGLAVLTLAAGVAVLGVLLLGLITPLLIAGAALYYMYESAQALFKAFPELIGLFVPALWEPAGRNMIDGIIQGITSGADRLHTAMTTLASSALSSFRSALGIHSPSSVFAGLGVAIPQGVAEGVSQGQSEATGAVGDMMSTTTNNVASVGGGQSSAVTTGEIHIHVGSEGEGAEDTAQSIADALREFFATGLATETA